jgi:trigger factor
LEITLEKSDSLNALIKVTLNEADYQEKVEKKIKDYAKKAAINGFRPGKVPPGIIRRMYGRSIKVEQINDLATNSLMEYIKQEQLSLLGSPLLSADQQEASIDWDAQRDFEFKFDIGLRPQFTPVVGPQIALTAYKVVVDEAAIDKFIAQQQSMLARPEPVEVVDAQTTLYGRLVTASGEPVELPPLELTNPGPTPEPPRMVMGANTEGYGLIEMRKLAPAHHDLFLGKKAGDQITFDLRTLFPTPKEVEELTGFEAEHAAHLQGEFVLTLQDIQVKKDLEVNQDFFDKVLGPGKVTDEEGFRAHIRALFQRRYDILTSDQLVVDFQKEIKQANPVALPAEFLKRWLASNRDSAEENIDDTYAKLEGEFQWEILRNNLAKANNVSVNQDDVLQYLYDVSFLQILNMNFLSMLDFEERFAKNMLNDREDRSKVDSYYSIALTFKVFSTVRDQLTVAEKQITEEEFTALRASLQQ